MTPRDYLAQLEFHGIKLGLENITELLHFADEPHHAFPTVHVAGTNGKGSVLAFLDTMLRAAGYRTGRFTSPHLIDVSERFLVNGQPINDRDLDTQIEFFQSRSNAHGLLPTYFEMVTAIAFNWFRDQHLDLSLIEVGMGGRFDATNVLTPDITAITTIDMDHMRYLGDTLESIAFEKAGIIKPGVPVVLGKLHPTARKVVLDRASECGAPVTEIGRDLQYRQADPQSPFEFDGRHISAAASKLGLPGRHQAANAAVACGMAELLAPRFPKLDAESIRTGLETALWPCRLERVLDSPPVIIDAAHNPAGLAESARDLPPCVMVFAVSADKDAAEMLPLAAAKAEHLILTAYSGGRALSLDALSRAAGNIPHEAIATVEAAIDRGLSLASSGRPLVVLGSLFLAGEARKYLSARYGAAPLRF